MELLVVTQPVNGYEAGDIIAVRPDGAVWGRREAIHQWIADGNNANDFPHPEFTVIQIPGEPADLNLTEPETVVDPVDGPKIVKNRAWRFDVESLEPDIRSAVDQPGALVDLPRTDRSLIRRKRDDHGLPLRADNDKGTTGRADSTQTSG